MALKTLTGESQGDICKRIGVVQATWSRWEAGTYPIPSLALIALAQRYNIDGGYLLSGNKSALRRDLADAIDALEQQEEVG